MKRLITRELVVRLLQTTQSAGACMRGGMGVKSNSIPPYLSQHIRAGQNVCLWNLFYQNLICMHYVSNEHALMTHICHHPM